LLLNVINVLKIFIHNLQVQDHVSTHVAQLRERYQRRVQPHHQRTSFREWCEVRKHKDLREKSKNHFRTGGREKEETTGRCA